MLPSLILSHSIYIIVQWFTTWYRKPIIYIVFFFPSKFTDNVGVYLSLCGRLRVDVGLWLHCANWKGNKWSFHLVDSHNTLAGLQAKSKRDFRLDINTDQFRFHFLKKNVFSYICNSWTRSVRWTKLKQVFAVFFWLTSSIRLFLT